MMRNKLFLIKIINGLGFSALKYIIVIKTIEED